MCINIYILYIILYLNICCIYVSSQVCLLKFRKQAIGRAIGAGRGLDSFPGVQIWELSSPRGVQRLLLQPTFASLFDAT